MRNILILSTILGTITMTSCSLDIEPGSPDCLKSKIREFRNNPCDSGNQVARYSFQGVAVYVFAIGDCAADYTNEVVNSKCETLGKLGGFAGVSEINGVNFYEEAIFESIVWEN